MSESGNKKLPEIPGYELIKPLGHGGMATVWLARQLNFDRQVAIKLMSGQLAESESFIARFLHEAKTVANLTHPGIITVHDMGESDAGLYLTMEYLPGPDLKERLKTGDVSIAEGVHIVEQIAEALHHAHQNNVIHRDIKPANILFRGDGSPVLVDFGIARNLAATTQLTVAGTILGTPAYMSPEQCRGDPNTDYRADIYSLGVLLFLLLDRTLPFQGDSLTAFSYKHLEEPVPPLSSANARWQPVVEKAMAKQPQERFQSAGDMAAAIRAMATDETVSSVSCDDSATTIIRPPEPSGGNPRWRKWVPAAAVVGAALAAFLLLRPVSEEQLAEQPQPPAENTAPAPDRPAASNGPASPLPVDTTLSTVTPEAIEEALVRAKIMLWNGDMFEPEGRNALAVVDEVLMQAPDNTEAQALKDRLLNTLRAQVEQHIASGEYEVAAAGIRRLRETGDNDAATQLASGIPK